ncbi:MBL fold metallo-hydrolase [Rhodococcus sp. JVH1]|uniref:MBL fold metallo-hydrolase n=1 Tax=Rhodococcus sp. JVH1 TaxID=745408 RepID=UPI000271EA68|nr:MBL fold metallo-hydrolase [Rhodococcus sp. JVH1]EJI97319.1 tat (twin-arginine translocation) pathway signal sequence domain protein [Rhodococcus sp. JVH1]
MEAVGGHALSRRRALALLGSAATAVAATSCASHTSDAQPSGATPPDAYELSGDVDGYATTLILLGTAAGPIAVPGRSGTSSVLVVGDRPYLIDAGPWSSRKLIQAGIAADSLGGVFVTHMHSDHIADLFNVFWLPGGTPSYTFRDVVPVYGPGSAGRLSGCVRRQHGAGDGTVPGVRRRPGPGHRDAGSARPRLSLAGVPVRHGGRCGHVLRRHREIGECRPARPRIRHPRPRGDRRRLLRADFGSRTGRAHDQAHSTAQDVGRVATDADVRQVVLSHIGPGDPRQVTDDQWERGVKSTFAGTVTVGHDLVRIGVGQRR